MFTRGDELGSFVEVMFGIEMMSESGLGEDISFLLTVVVLLVVVEFFSSSGIISEKKKKKKDKVFRLICIYRCICIYIIFSFNFVMGIYVIVIVCM